MKFSPSGIETDDHLRTANPAVYAAGDVAQPEKYTHAAIATAKLAVTNALDGAEKRLSEPGHPALHIHRPGGGPGWGHSQEAERRGMAIETHRMELAKVERAVIGGGRRLRSPVHARRAVGRGNLRGGTRRRIRPLLTLAVAQKMTPTEFGGGSVLAIRHRWK